MTEPEWSRPHWTRDDAKAMLVYFVFGEFAAELRLDLSTHGSAGLPAAVQIGRIPKAMLAHWEGHPLRGALGEILREGNPDAFEAARKAPECLMLRGELPDSDSLDYLRDTLGVVAALLDVGGGAGVKTRGMRKFARPDVSIRRVPQAEVQRAGAVAARLVELQAHGMRFGDGSTLDVEGLPGGLKMTRGGSLEDPEFNNTHLELIWADA